MILHFKNFQLQTLQKVIGYPMSFQKSRLKSRFLSNFTMRMHDTEKWRMDMLTELSEKDAEGKPVLEDNPNDKTGQKHFKMTPENLAKFNQEYALLMSEDCIVEIPEASEHEIGEIKGLINNSPVEIDEREALLTDSIVMVLNGERPPVVRDAKDESAPAPEPVADGSLEAEKELEGESVEDGVKEEGK